MKQWYILGLIGVIVLLILYCYSGRNVPIRIWDEAIYANNAIEMNQSGDYLILRNNGQPTLYNTKPPLVIWLQSLSIHFFGINEFAIRLPSILSFFLIIVALVYFLHRHNFLRIPQAFTVLTLFTSGGFIGQHVMSTGDLDGVLCLWTTLMFLILFDVLLSERNYNINRKLMLAGLVFLGGYFTKSTAILLVIPGLLLSIFLSGKWKLFFYNKLTYLIILACMLIIAGYYWILYTVFPGYFEKVWFSEVERFYRNIMPWHEQPWHFYFSNLSHRYFPWYLILIPMLGFGLFSKSLRVRKLVGMAAVCCASYLILISIPTVKLLWYDAPVYPLFAMIIGVGIYECFIRIKVSFRNGVAYSFIVLLACCYAFSFYSMMRDRNKFVIENQEREGYFIKRLFKKHALKNSTVIMSVEHPEHYDQLNFYRKKFKKENLEIGLISTLSQIREQDTLIVCQQLLIDSIHKKFEVDTLLKEDGCLVIKIR